MKTIEKFLESTHDQLIIQKVKTGEAEKRADFYEHKYFDLMKVLIDKGLWDKIQKEVS